MIESVEDRVAQIHGSFKRSRLDAAGRSFWEHWSTENASFVIGMSLALITICLEPGLWYDDWPPLLLDIPDSVAFLMLSILPLNGLFLDRFLASKTAREMALPRWLLGIRLLAVSLPVLGIFVLSVWKEILDRKLFRSREAPQAQILSLSQDRRRLPAGVRFRQFYKSGVFFLWIAASFLPLLVWAFWLASTSLFGSSRQSVILGACVGLHLASSAFIAMYVRSLLRNDRVTGWRRGRLLTVPVLWLLGSPGMILGLSLLVLLDPSRQPLSWSAYARRTTAARVLLWQDTQGALRQRWGRMPWFVQWRRPTGLGSQEASGQADAEILGFYRLKTLLLVLDSAAFLAAVSALAIRIPDLANTLNTAVRWMTYAVMTLAAAGLLIQLAGVSARLLRISALTDTLSRCPYGRYILLPHAAFLAGTQGAFLLIGGQVEQFGILFCLSSALCAMASVLFFMFKPAVQDMMLWASLFISLSALGVLIALHPQAALRSLDVFKALTVLALLWGFGLFLTLGDWLLRPFSWRHVSARNLPRRFRATLTLVVLSSALPLGGLAIPFWIYARQRIWPRYEPLLYKLHGEGHAP